MKTIKIMLLLAIAIPLFTACNLRGNDEIELSQALTEVMETANARRRVVTPDFYRVIELVQGREVKHISEIGDFTPTNEMPPFSITTEAAMADAEDLFRILRYWYGGYNYFGGDDVFIPMFESIHAQLATQETWSFAAFLQLIQGELSEVILDNHFNFITARGNPAIVGFSYSTFTLGAAFDRVGEGFVNRETGLKVLEVEGHEIEEVFRYAVGSEGEFFYTPVLIRHPSYGNLYRLTITYEGGERVIYNIVVDSHMRAMGGSAVLNFYNDIPILNIESFLMDIAIEYHDFADFETIGDMMLYYGYMQMRTWYESENIARFLSYADKLQDEPVIIIDLRSNGGGWTGLQTTWLYRLLGQLVPNSFARIGPAPLAPTTTAANMERMLHMSQHRIAVQGAHIPAYEYSVSFIARDDVVPNQQIIILLVSEQTGSASELFTDKMLSIENTLILGQNTWGNRLTSGEAWRQLPNSRLPFRIGNTLLLDFGNEFQEGLGISPDVWVVGDALDAALAMLEQHVRF